MRHMNVHRTIPVCGEHPLRNSIAECDLCGVQLCKYCVKRSLHVAYCQQCFQKREGKEIIM